MMMHGLITPKFLKTNFVVGQAGLLAYLMDSCLRVVLKNLDF